MGGVFGVFNAKIIVFMARVLVLSIKFSFHSISGYALWRAVLMTKIEAAMLPVISKS